jgi:hypothetical protein
MKVIYETNNFEVLLSGQELDLKDKSLQLKAYDDFALKDWIRGHFAGSLQITFTYKGRKFLVERQNEECFETDWLLVDTDFCLLNGEGREHWGESKIEEFFEGEVEIKCPRLESLLAELRKKVG